MVDIKEKEFRGHRFKTEIITDLNDGRDYECMTVADFAKATGRHTSQIHSFIKKGTYCGRKLRVIRLFDNRPFVLYSELFEFVFTANKGVCYCYDKNGTPIFKESKINE